MTVAGGQSRSLARDQMQLWSVLALMVLLLLGIVLFIFLVLLPDIRRRTEYHTVLASAEIELRVAQLAKAEAPAKLQTRLAEAQTKLAEAAKAFLTEAESTVVVNRLYTYADEAAVEIVNLRTAPAIVSNTHSQRDYQFQVAGTPELLLGFLGRIQEVNLPGFVVNNVSIVPNPDADPNAAADSGVGEEEHLLTMNVSVVTSPYSTRLANEPTQDFENFANVGDLPLAEVQRQVELLWTARDWEQAINLLEQVVESSPENASARVVLYRAHVNYGYHYLSERNDAAAKTEFEAALAILPDGREAIAELQQIATDSSLSYSVEDRLRQEVEQAKAAGNWQEVIRLLRIIAAVDPAYGPVGDQLNQAYINYGNQLASEGDTVRAEEQYQLAQYPSPSQPPITAAVAIAIASPLTGTVVSPAVVTSAETPVSPPTSMPVPTATPVPTSSPTPVPTNTPVPTATPMPTATPPPPPTATSTSTATSVPVSPATATPTATTATSTGVTATPTATTVGAPPVATQVPPPAATYIVQQGDTLFSIAQRFGTTVEALRAANGLPNNNIRAGQVLFITPPSSQSPSPGYIEHTVAPNDTLFSIAQRYGTTVEAIMQANGLNSNLINVGQRLLIPVPVSVVPLVTPEVVKGRCDPAFAGLCNPSQL